MHTATRPTEAKLTDASNAALAPEGRLHGKRVGMVMFSSYPSDPRPRRAVEALLQEGTIVDLICLNEDNQLRQEVIEQLRIWRIPIKRTRGGVLSFVYQYSAFILISAWIFALQSMKKRYDLIYVHNMPDILVLSSIVPKALGARVILDQHDPMPELMMTIFDIKKDSLGVRILQRLEKWSIERVDLVLTVNIACKRIFASRSCNPSKIGIVMNAPDGEIFPLREPRERQPASDPFSKRFILMYHGTIVERNGLDLAVEALARIRNTVPDLEFRIYGRSTPFLERVMEQVRSQGLEDRVRYLGSKRLEDLVGAIEECDVGVIPNQRNAFTDINTPTRIFEYLALGKPVIAPRTPGIQDYFGPEALIFFESGSSEELAERIEYIATHANEAMETAKRGQQVYRSHVWQQERHTLVGLIDGLLKSEH